MITSITLEYLQSELINAMKKKNNNIKECLQIVISDIKNEQIKCKANLDEDSIIKVIRKEVKKLEETISMSEGRDTTEYDEQLFYLKKFIPVGYSDEEIMHIIDKMCRGMNEKGRIMKTVIPLLRGRADNRRVSELVDIFLRK